MEKLSTKSTKTPVLTDYSYLMSNDGVSDGKIKLQDITIIPETTRTININNTMTTSEIQDEINTIGKFIPQGIAITIQFANGTYNLDDQLSIGGFYGAGSLNVYGDSSQTGLRTDQNVHLDFSGDATAGLVISGNIVGVTRFSFFKVTVDDGYACVTWLQNTMVYTNANYFITTGKTSNASIGQYVIANGATQIYDTYFSGMHSGIVSTHASVVYSANNDDTGTQPNHGLVVAVGAVIGKAGTQPAGSIANETSQSGGIIL